jgi:hypothetical protein
VIATLSPFSRAACHSVFAFSAFAYQCQSRLDPFPVQTVFAWIPCFAGSTPVTIDAWAG